ncbi:MULTISPECIES: competence type IV pilus minor pilin ComGD [Sporosarcina]|uniref:competence type IV pilus minor pilin ComGD n=1 Tax=Sporosarcina TaxID=1569 RepID=UPI00058D383A|nr:MULTISPECIES: competence type IV pilus minor pilin ComGD [Sporosarcina]WJY28457.1 competence type IV pilus minor pilin ComGD [Sporosarcina sp. 0.2-SM1T-5]
MKWKSEAGMTFLELLLVLMVVGVLTLLIIPVGKGWSSGQTEQDGIEAFKAAVHHMQSYSMAHKARTSMTFSGDGSVYTIVYSDRPETRPASFPTSITLDDSSSFRSIVFQANGDMQKTGTLYLKTDSGGKKIKFQFQRGRMIIDG